MISYILGGDSLDRVDALRELCLQSKLAIETSRLVNLEGELCDRTRYGGNKVEFGLTLMCQRLKPKKIRGFAVWMGAGCESLFLGLAETEAGFKFEGACATFGDKTPSIEVFEHRHITAISVLDLAVLANLGVDVLDESSYWKFRNLTKLRRAADDKAALTRMLESYQDNPLVNVLREMQGGQFDDRPT